MNIMLTLSSCLPKEIDDDQRKIQETHLVNVERVLEQSGDKTLEILLRTPGAKINLLPWVTGKRAGPFVKAVRNNDISLPAMVEHEVTAFVEFFDEEGYDEDEDWEDEDDDEN